MRGEHALLCGIGGGNVARHNKIRDVIKDLIEARLPTPVHVEPHYDDLENKRPDLLFWDSRATPHLDWCAHIMPHSADCSGGRIDVQAWARGPHRRARQATEV